MFGLWEQEFRAIIVPLEDHCEACYKFCWCFYSPQGTAFFLECDRDLAPITILMSSPLPYVVTLGAAGIETLFVNCAE